MNIPTKLTRLVRSRKSTISAVSPLILYPIIRLSLKGKPFYFRTIRKLKINELPAI
jgi:hypothetical protein